MDFTLSEEQQALVNVTRQFAQKELADYADKIEKTGLPAPRILLQRFAEMGFLGVNLPAHYGGGGMSHLDAVLVLEELAKVSVAAAFPVFESCFGPALAIAHYGPEQMRTSVLPNVCSGSMIVAVSMSEPQAGTALTDLKTELVPNGKSFVLRGTKRWCSGAGHADAYVVYCKMSDAPGAKGIGAVLVHDGVEGFTFGAPEEHMGFRGIPSADMYLSLIHISEPTRPY